MRIKEFEDERDTEKIQSDTSLVSELAALSLHSTRNEKQRVLVENTKEGSHQENTRVLNIIIHSINESKPPDNLFIKELFCITEVKTSPPPWP